MPEAIQDPRLRECMADAARHIPLYRRLWGDPERGAGRHSGRLLDKAALRAAPLEERVHALRRGRPLASELSSGSSGEPLTVHSDRRAWWARRMAFLRALLHCGYLPGHRLLLLTSRRGRRDAWLARWRYESIGDDTASLVRRAAEFAPHVLYGPLSTLELLAHQVTEHLPRLRSLRFVISTAEQLTGERLQTLERAFGVPVADFYGLSEFGLVAYRPPGAAAYVPARSSLVLEFRAVPHDRAIEQLVVSDLAERTCPILRYDTGDFVRRDPKRPGIPVVEFAGRDFDCILMPNGERVSPYRIDVALEHLPDLKAFEVVQQPDLSLDVTFDVPAGAVERTRRAIGDRLGAIFGNAVPCRLAAGVVRRPPGVKFRPIRSLAGARA